jgi:hypothetical protein
VKIITGTFSFTLSSNIEHSVPNSIALYPNGVDFIVIVGGVCIFNKKTLDAYGLNFRDHDVINSYLKFSSKGIGYALIFGKMVSLASTRSFSASNRIHYLGNKTKSFAFDENKKILLDLQNIGFTKSIFI